MRARVPIRRDAPLYAEGLRTAVRQNSTAYGFSIMVTASFGVLAAFDPHLRVWECFLFAVGAAAGFPLVLVAATKGFRERTFDADRPEVLVVAALLNVSSVLAGVGTAALVAWPGSGGWYAWLFAPVAGSVVYLLVNGFEYTVAEQEEDPDCAQAKERGSAD